MSSVEEYRRHAAQCLSLAQNAKSAEDRTLFKSVGMAAQDAVAAMAAYIQAKAGGLGQSVRWSDSRQDLPVRGDV